MSSPSSTELNSPAEEGKGRTGAKEGKGECHSLGWATTADDDVARTKKKNVAASASAQSTSPSGLNRPQTINVLESSSSGGLPEVFGASDRVPGEEDDARRRTRAAESQRLRDGGGPSLVGGSSGGAIAMTGIPLPRGSDVTSADSPGLDVGNDDNSADDGPSLGRDVAAAAADVGVGIEVLSAYRAPSEATREPGRRSAASGVAAATDGDYAARARRLVEEAPVVVGTAIPERGFDEEGDGDGLEKKTLWERRRNWCIAGVILVAIAVGVTVGLVVGLPSSKGGDDGVNGATQGAEEGPEILEVTDSPTSSRIPSLPPSPISTTVHPTLSSRPTSSPSISFAPTSGRFMSVRSSLLRLVPPEMRPALLDPSSPQYMAALWLAEEDPASIIASFPKDVESEEADASARIVQRYALAVLYFANNGGGWRNTFNNGRPESLAPPFAEEDNMNAVAFLSGRHECDWNMGESGYRLKGVECAAIAGVVDRINFGGVNMTGSLPAEFSLLRFLDDVYLGHNFLTGQIPRTIGTLQNLTKFVALNNTLSGTLSSALGDLPLLEYLDLSKNDVGGTIPSELGRATSLRVLYLLDNQLSGTLPDEMSDLSNLALLYVGQNLLEGTLPPWIGNLTNLALCSVRSNSLTGTIPLSAFGDSAPELSQFDVASNRMSGQIPDSVGGATKLQQLLLEGNNFTGPIPSSLGDLPDLGILRLQGNALTGEFPFGPGAFPQLYILDASSNQLRGNVPASAYSLPTSVNYLYLDDNLLTGSLPNSLGGLSYLNELGLSGNLLSGPIPTALATPELFPRGLDHIFLGDNSMDGEIPPGIGGHSDLKILSLEKNNFGGTIPSSFGSFDCLVVLSLHSNQLTGKLPAEIGNNTRMQILDLGDNKLHGTVPDSFRNLGELEWLSLIRNDLSGSLDGVCASTSIPSLFADCGGSSPEIACGCCSYCCISGDGDGSGGCDFFVAIREAGGMYQSGRFGGFEQCRR